ncbi:hypothetical protein ACSBR2_025425 [Camellia fascicularis]
MALRLQNISLGGTISPHIGNLLFLMKLDLRNNIFHGFVMQNLTPLRGNNLAGNLPSNTGLSHPNLKKFGVKFNKLSGKIPLYLSNCSELNKLVLPSNQFIGPIPIIFGHLSIFEKLFLQHNQLTIEQEVLKLVF